MKIDFFDKLLYILFPKRCACCGKVIYPVDTFCDSCDKEKCRIPFPKCERCGQEIDRCECSGTKHTYDRIFAPFYYEDEVKDSIINLKYKGHVDNAGYLSEEMARTLCDSCNTKTIDLIVCVPMTKRKQRIRGFSQTELLAENVAEITGIKFDKNILIKTKNTPAQVGLNAKERLENLKGSFAVSKYAELKGKTIVVCDDNKTTGATLDECAKVLKKAGAKTVIALTAALIKNNFKGEAD